MKNETIWRFQKFFFIHLVTWNLTSWRLSFWLQAFRYIHTKEGNFHITQEFWLYAMKIWMGNSAWKISNILHFGYNWTLSLFKCMSSKVSFKVVLLKNLLKFYKKRTNYRTLNRKKQKKNQILVNKWLFNG